MPADSTGDANKRRALTSSRVDRCNDFFGHYKNLIGKDSASDAMLQAARVFFRTRLPVRVRGIELAKVVDVVNAGNRCRPVVAQVNSSRACK